MNTKQWKALVGLSIGALVTMIALPALADDTATVRKAVMKIAIDSEDLSSFDISDLALGDVKTVTTESGKEVTITRTEAGYQLDVDGKIIDVKIADGTDIDVDANSTHKVVVVAGSGEGSAVKVMKKVIVLDGDDTNATGDVTLDDDQVLHLGSGAKGKGVWVQVQSDRQSADGESKQQQIIVIHESHDDAND